MFYILSRSKAEAIKWAASQGLNIPKHATYISSPEFLRGRHHGLKFVRVGRWKEKRNHAQIEYMLRVGFAVEITEDDLPIGIQEYPPAYSPAQPQM